MALQSKKLSLTKILHIYSEYGNNSHPLKERSVSCYTSVPERFEKSFELVDLIFALFRQVMF